MKTIIRLVIILSAAALVCAFAFFVLNLEPAGQSAGMETLQFSAASETYQSGSTQFRPEFNTENHNGHGDEGFSAAGFSGVLMTLAKLAGLVLLVLCVQKAFDFITRKPAALKRGT